MTSTSRRPLNDRQRAYLLAIFEVDQAVEAEMREMPYRPFQPRPKASEWRWPEYSEPVPEIQKPASRVYTAIKKAAPIDQGTGATFAALADRGLVQVEWRERSVWGQPKPYLRLTTAGRKLARTWTGQKAYTAPPAGTPARVALAGPGACLRRGRRGPRRHRGWGDYGRIGWNTWQRLRDYKWGALVEARETGWYSNPTTGGSRAIYRLFITAAGRALYERAWVRYRELYPNTEVAEAARAGPGGR